MKKITVIGGGPGGLYFAILTKKRCPDVQIDVYEQNQPDDTFGFGVVFSDETLDGYREADEKSYDMIRAEFANWSDIVIEHKDERIVIGGNGFAGCSRMTMLQKMHERCEELGVNLHFGHVVDPETIRTQFKDSDIIVAADGINSPIRRANAQAFGEKTDIRPNQFVWLGSTCPLDAFTFFYRETEHGHFCAHTYQYEAEGSDSANAISTWVVETTAECWDKTGFADMSEQESADYLEALFKDDLKGHGFITNRSLWRNFPKTTCEKWDVDNIVMVGDNKATAHWSIGSGTKLAMDCAIGLSDAVVENLTDYKAAFAQYEDTRRTPVEIVQHNAQVSLVWFENMASHWQKTPYEFAFSVMTRAKSVTWDNLQMRDAGFMDKVEAQYYESYKIATGNDVSEDKPTPMFTEYKMRDMVLPNRVVMAPMAQYCAVNGVPNDWHFNHYTSRAVGGTGLIFTEMTCPSADARITEGCTGIWNEEQVLAWRKIVDNIHVTTESKICIQLGHAGRKGSTKTPEHGMDMPKDDGNWPLISASPIPYMEGISDTPREITKAQMDVIKDQFVMATKNADKAGFDMIEHHCAHGYLFASFLSPLTNTRTDEYGGTVENRIKFPLEVFKAMRAVWPKEKPMSVRISACDWAEGGISEADVIRIAKAFKEADVDIMHVSSGETVKWQKPVFGRMWQTPLSELVRREADIPTITVGAITLPEQINTIIAAGRADLCALARPHLNTPYFTRHAAGQYGVRTQKWPGQLHSGQFQLFREAEKSKEKYLELAAKARPNRRHYQHAKVGL
ncbi:MAG: oxidoreductase [Robiginitomaculum sp.]|nr:MAG: oxidoreductase [Robiginitomaculum sp.]